MHVAFIDSNPAALQAIPAAKAAGHEVTFIEAAVTEYVRTPGNERLIGMADHLVRGARTTDATALTRLLAECHAKWPIDVVTSQFEFAAEAAAVACRNLGLAGTNPSGVLTARRKDLARKALTDAGLATARYAVAGDEDAAVAAAGAIGYPVVVKPPSGADSRLARVAADEPAVRDACRAMRSGATRMGPWRQQFARGFLVEELLSGRMVSAEIGRRGSEFFLFGISGRVRWAGNEVIELGACVPADLTPAQAARCGAYARQVCEAIGLDNGIFHLEMILTSRGPVLVEANPRIMGGALPTIYRYATGLDVFAALLQIFAGEPVDRAGGFQAVTGGRKVAVRAGGRIPPGASLRRLAGHPSVLDVAGFADFGTAPGRDVREGQVIARFLLREPSHTALAVTSDDLLRELEADFGLSLMRGDKDRETAALW